MPVKIMPIKRYLIPRPGKGIEYREICKGFEPKEEFLKCNEIKASCTFCKNAEFHGGYDCVDRMGGCICLAGCDPRDNGQYKANLREEIKQKSKGGSRT